MEQKQEIRAVIFDLGGVILRTEDPQPRTLLAQQYGMTYAELEEVVFNNPIARRGESGGATSEEVWEEVARRMNLNAEQIPAFRRQFFAGDKVDFSLIKLIQSLRSNYRTALLSNTWIVDLPRFLREDLQIPDTFDVIISSAEAGVAKPNPEIFQVTLDKVGAKPEEAVFVDDNFANIEAASAMGIRTVRFFDVEEARRALATFVQVP